MSRPEDALRDLAALLASEHSVISEHVSASDEVPAFGLLAAAGPRAAESPADYAFVVESVREGYLLHYGRPRLFGEIEPDLALLAGDYLYALGLERLAALGDLEAVRELSDLISLEAQVHGEGLGPETAEALWAAVTVGIAAGPGEELEGAKALVRSGATAAASALEKVASDTASRSGLSDRLGAVLDSIDFAAGGTS
jgi:hypothetical protein